MFNNSAGVTVSFSLLRAIW